MKLVIQTQCKENYSTHDADWTPSENDRWKFKGGSTYVVENLSAKSIASIEANGIPALTQKIETHNDAFVEYILDYSIEDDNAKAGDDWGTPYVLEYDAEIAFWRCTRFTDNRGECGYMRSEVATKTESWLMLPENDRADYKVMWVMEDGERGIGQDFITSWFALKEAA